MLDHILDFQSYYLEFFLIGSLSILMLSTLIYKRTNWWGVALFIYACISGLYGHFNPPLIAYNFGMTSRFTLVSQSASSVLWICLVCLSICLLKMKWFNKIGHLFLILGALNAISMLIRWCLKMPASGFQLNDAQDATFLSCLIPIILWWPKRAKWALMLLYLSAIWVSGATTPYLGVGLAFGLYFWFKFKWGSIKKIGVISATISAIAGLGIYHIGAVTFFSNNSRFELWSIALNWLSGRTYCQEINSI